MDKNVILGRSYRDRRGSVWKVEKIDGPALYPVTATRWEGKRYLCRCFQRNGQFEKDGDTLMDLIEPVRVTP